MKLYALTLEVDYEGSIFLGVFKTEKKALKAAKEAAKDHTWGDGYAIFKTTLDTLSTGFNGDLYLELDATGEIKEEYKNKKS